MFCARAEIEKNQFPISRPHCQRAWLPADSYIFAVSNISLSLRKKKVQSTCEVMKPAAGPPLPRRPNPGQCPYQYIVYNRPWSVPRFCQNPPRQSHTEPIHDSHKTRSYIIWTPAAHEAALGGEWAHTSSPVQQSPQPPTRAALDGERVRVLRHQAFEALDLGNEGEVLLLQKLHAVLQALDVLL